MSTEQTYPKCYQYPNHLVSIQNSKYVGKRGKTEMRQDWAMVTSAW